MMLEGLIQLCSGHTVENVVRSTWIRTPHCTEVLTRLALHSSKPIKGIGERHKGPSCSAHCCTMYNVHTVHGCTAVVYSPVHTVHCVAGNYRCTVQYRGGTWWPETNF